MSSKKSSKAKTKTADTDDTKTTAAAAAETTDTATETETTESAAAEIKPLRRVPAKCEIKSTDPQWLKDWKRRAVAMVPEQTK